jgi:hypothetical protein
LGKYEDFTDKAEEIWVPDPFGGDKYLNEGFL